MNRRIETINPSEIEKRVRLKFSGSRIDDPEYVNLKAGIELGRLIQKALRS